MATRTFKIPCVAHLYLYWTVLVWNRNKAGMLSDLKTTISSGLREVYLAVSKYIWVNKSTVHIDFWWKSYGMCKQYFFLSFSLPVSDSLCLCPFFIKHDEKFKKLENLVSVSWCHSEDINAMNNLECHSELVTALILFPHIKKSHNWHYYIYTLMFPCIPAHVCGRRKTTLLTCLSLSLKWVFNAVLNLSSFLLS